MLKPYPQVPQHMNIGASLDSSRSGAFNATTSVAVSFVGSCVTMRSSIDLSADR
jgi:hypothetical protein